MVWNYNTATGGGGGGSGSGGIMDLGFRMTGSEIVDLGLRV